MTPAEGSDGRPMMESWDVVECGAPLQRRLRPVPRPRGSEVLLRVIGAGVCHTDVHLWNGYFDLGGGKRLRMQDRGIVLPHTLGHETVGEVVALGPEAAGAALGDRRLVHPWIGCGDCPACAAGDEHFCVKPRFLGVFQPGGFSDHLLVPHPRYLHDFGDLSPAQAAPLACSGLTTYSALKKIGPVLGEAPIVVIGAGGLGLMCLSMLRAMGGKGAIVVDVDPKKREAASAAGAIAVVDGAAADAAQRIITLTDGGARAALDLVGTGDTVRLGLDCMAKGGRLVLVGMFGGEITLSIPALLLRGLSIVTSYVGSPCEMREMMALVRGGGWHGVPVGERPLGAATEALDALRRGAVVGRTVLVPNSMPEGGS